MIFFYFDSSAADEYESEDQISDETSSGWFSTSNVWYQSGFGWHQSQYQSSSSKFSIQTDHEHGLVSLSFFQYSDVLDLLDFQDYLTLKSKYQKYQIKNVPEQKRAMKK